MNKMIFPKELLKDAVIKASEIEAAYYEWETIEQGEHRFSRKYKKKMDELRTPESIRISHSKISMKVKIVLIAAIIMLMGSMTVFAVSPLREKVTTFFEELFGKKSEENVNPPTKTEVLSKRDAVLDGMTEEEIYRLRENIKALNLEMEKEYVYDNGFEMWTEKETTRFIQLMSELKDSMKTDLLDADFNNLVNNMVQARETGDVKYLEEIYHILHDMDYYLLRYGPEDVAAYMEDDSTVRIYYGVLEVYQKQHDTEEVSIKKEDAKTFYTFNRDELILNADFDISQCYITNEVLVGNHFYIDDEGTLWGNGYNEYGQLGLNRPGDINNLDIYYDEYVKIAENVVHVDTNGTTIFLTEDGNLYGMGINGWELLLAEDEEYNGYIENSKTQLVPKLLMTDVQYACLGNGNIMVLKKNGDVYGWGEFNEGVNTRICKEPVLLMRDVKYIAAADRYAVITKENELYMWGYNKWGECGTASDENFVSEPTKVLEDVVMVWLDELRFNSPKGQSQTPDEVYKYRYYNNTFVLLENRQFAACGKDIGQYERIEDNGWQYDEETEDYGSKEIVSYSPEFLYIEVRGGKVG